MLYLILQVSTQTWWSRKIDQYLLVSHVMLSYRQVSFFDVTDCNAFTMARLFALLPTWCCLLVLSLLDWLKGAIMASLPLTHIIRVKFELVDVLAKLGTRSFSVRR